MGGYGSGGHNKTHRQVEDYHRIDSFALYDFLRGDKYLYYKTDVCYSTPICDIIYHVNNQTASMCVKGGYSALDLSIVPNIDGKTKRMYFLCPKCKQRVRYLYGTPEGCVCRKCAGLNYGSQQKGGIDALLNRMRYIVEKELGYSFDLCCDVASPRYMRLEKAVTKPRYMRLEKYEALVKELDELQETLIQKLRS